MEVQGFDRAMALAGQGFAALLPLLIVIPALTPRGGRDFADRLIENFDLPADTAVSVEQAVATPVSATSSFSVFGVLILVISALSFTRALQRLFERAWRMPKLGLLGNVYGLIWLVAFTIYLGLNPLIAEYLGNPESGLVALSAATILWLFTPWLLLGRRLSMWLLLPQALLTAIIQAVLGAASVIYMPRTVSQSAEQFGTIGIAFSLLSWLFVVCIALVSTASIGAVIGGYRQTGEPVEGSAEETALLAALDAED